MLLDIKELVHPILQLQQLKLKTSRDLTALQPTEKPIGN